MTDIIVAYENNAKICTIFGVTAEISYNLCEKASLTVKVEPKSKKEKNEFAQSFDVVAPAVTCKGRNLVRLFEWTRK